MRGHQEYRFTLPVSLTISILAVFVAGATLLGHRAHTERLLLQIATGVGSMGSKYYLRRKHSPA